MTTLWSWASSTDTTYDSVAGTAPTVASGGTYGERFVFAATTAPENIGKLASAAGNFGVRFVCSIASLAGSTTVLAEGRSSATALNWRAALSSTGLIRIFDESATQVAQGTVALVSGGSMAEHRFEVFRVGTTLTVKAYRTADNVLRDTVTGTVAANALFKVYFGPTFTLTAPAQGETTYDEIVVTDVGAEVGPPPSPTQPLSATVALSPTTGTAPFTLTATITATGGTGSYTYSVTNWGDGSSSGSQSSNVFTKSIASGAALGTKTVTVSVVG